MSWPLLIAMSFFALVTGLAIAGTLPLWMLGLYCGASLVTYTAYALDKSAARSHRWRISERTLHLLALVGGWPGALVAQTLLRHKSKKPSFQTVFWATVTINCAALATALSTPGAALLRSMTDLV